MVLQKDPQELVFGFFCETTEAGHSVDRYLFRLAFPRANLVEVSLEPTEEPNPQTVTVAEGAHDRWRVFEEPPSESDGHYTVTFLDWHPEASETPARVAITWTGMEGHRNDDLPGRGLYGIQVSLQEESDRTTWTVIEYD